MKKYPNITAGLGKVTKGFGESTMYEKMHPGVDFANKKGTKVPSFTPGTVVKVTDGHKQGEQNFGNSVTIRDGSGNIHNYNHLQRPFVRPGQRVGRGAQIGSMGNTGAAYSPSGKGDGTHLDYRVTNAFNRMVNPQQFLN